jgi:probable HAF family extracellular repeat protein
MLSFGPNWTYAIDSWFNNPAEAAAYDVNNRNQIVGWLAPKLSSPRTAYLYDAGIGRLINLGTLGGVTSEAYGVNDLGQVVGTSQTSSGFHAFIFKDADNDGIADAGEMRDLDNLGSLQSGARSINNAGIAVGYYGGPDVIYGNSRAAIFYPNGQMIDLNTLIAPGSGWTLRTATGINDNGQIVGWMQDANSNRHAFRIDPPPPRILTVFP